HKRGYRSRSMPGQLKENLAAGIVMMTFSRRIKNDGCSVFVYRDFDIEARPFFRHAAVRPDDAVSDRALHDSLR
ncbi:MAG: hypothetical protein AAFR76_15100, partial [Planctomycetota bacterium]